MSKDLQGQLSRRERQIMEIVYRLGRASAKEVHAELENAPSYSTVRTHLSILEQKGFLRHEQDGPRYLYQPTLARSQVRRTALSSLLRNFFDGSREQLVTALLDDQSAGLSSQELDNLSSLIEQVRKKGR